ncbi:putative secreted protein [Propionispora sp. 2/2-37]|uniref:hypothetical protein n=1 Tax=Propionispora sp. 2/2-37 TaxID=1677858 RepID=UPI0006BB6229|nr:hypothetical protein [Propionispora sp. 2/2-37]CUH95582.1 putative secreted protein [Propionispora sp. 2/2-37]
MRKLSLFTILSILCLFLISIGTVFAEEPVKTPFSKPDYRIAIIPYINSSEETKGYIKETIDNKYSEQYSNDKFKMIPIVDVQKALNVAGYDASNMELPDKEVLSTVAKETNADYVIAMEISQLITTRHISFFQSKVVTKSKLRYKFYNVEQDKVISFQTTGLSENKTVFGDVGYKDPITKALSQAMDEANEKIMSSL